MVKFVGDGPAANAERIKQLYAMSARPLSKAEMEQTGLSYNQVKSAVQYLVRHDGWIGLKDDREDRNTQVYRPALSADEARDYTLGAHAKGLNSNIETYVKSLARWVDGNDSVDLVTKHRYDNAALAHAALTSTEAMQTSHEREMAREQRRHDREVARLKSQLAKARGRS